jgi:hypothetical protein
MRTASGMGQAVENMQRLAACCSGVFDTALIINDVGYEVRRTWENVGALLPEHEPICNGVPRLMPTPLDGRPLSLDSMDPTRQSQNPVWV